MTNSTIRLGDFFRTIDPKTAKIERDWALKERLAFNNKAALSVEDLMKIMPERALKPLGDFQPTDEVFRKLATGYGKVSEGWLRLGRMIGVWDFSVEQAAFIQVAVFLDSINVRVRPHLVVEDANRANSIEYFCLGDPDYQGKICYYGDRLAVTENLFERVLRPRLDVFKLYCDYLTDVLEIPGESDVTSLLLLAAKDTDESEPIAVVDELDTVVNHELSEPSDDGDDDTAEGEISGIFVVSPSEDSGVQVDEVYNNGEHTPDEVAAVAEEVLPVPEKAKRGRPKGGKKSAETEADSLPSDSPSEAEADGLGVDLAEFQEAIESHAIQDMAQAEPIADDERSGEAVTTPETEEPYHDTSQEEANQAEDEQAARMADVYADPSFSNLEPPENQQFGY